jgi:hypothetical protein
MPERIEYKDTAIGLIDDMISCKIFKKPEGRHGIEDYYDVYKLEFTDEFDYDMKETLLRLASDPNNESVNLLEGLKSIVLNYLKEWDIDEEELEEMIMMILSLKTINSDIGR